MAFLRLLDDDRVAAEIERYKWIESEKSNQDIGRERAAWEWISAYGHVWLTIHKPEEYKVLSEKYSAPRGDAEGCVCLSESK